MGSFTELLCLECEKITHFTRRSVDLNQWATGSSAPQVSHPVLKSMDYPRHVLLVALVEVKWNKQK